MSDNDTFKEKLEIIYIGNKLEISEEYNEDEEETKQLIFSEFIKTIPDNKFSRTKINVNDENKRKNIEDLNQRLSWTYDNYIYVNNDNVNDLDFCDLKFKLLKYEKGGFFNLHKDHKGTHTCLILGGSDFKGGVLTLKNNLFNIKVDTNEMKNGYYMIIFSIDFLHEVSPVTEGERFVLKTSLDRSDKGFFHDDDDNCVEDCYTDSDNDVLDIDLGKSNFMKHSDDDY